MLAGPEARLNKSSLMHRIAELEEAIDLAFSNLQTAHDPDVRDLIYRVADRCAGQLLRLRNQL